MRQSSLATMIFSVPHPESESTLARYRRLLASGPSLERTAAFSDAIFAIAMTLLVLDVRVPDVPSAKLPTALFELIPRYLTFVLSFLVVGIVWMSHHRKFLVIRMHDQMLLRLNLFMLLFVASLPFPTALLGRYGDDQLPVYLYAANICLIGLLMALLWWHAWRRGFVDRAVTASVYGYVLLRSLMIPAAFALSIPITVIFGASAGERSWILAYLLLLGLDLIYRRNSAPRAR